MQIEGRSALITGGSQGLGAALGRALAREGPGSALWARTRRQGSPARMKLAALNEPESSVHPDLMASLADLVVRAGKRTQAWLVTHSERLAELVGRADGGEIRRVLKKDGATWIDGLTLIGAYSDDDDQDLVVNPLT